MATQQSKTINGISYKLFINSRKKWSTLIGQNILYLIVNLNSTPTKYNS